MHGGEYLSEDLLQRIWTDLDAWVRARVAAEGGLAALLRARAPRWHQVGRVCFHLAENKNDEVRPFAFMATYASGFGASGRVKHLPLRRALEQYAGARNRAALIKLLSPIDQAGETCGWVRDIVESGRVYQPLAWSAERAYELLRSVPALEAAGLSVRLPNWWRKRARPQVRVTIGGRKQARLGADAMLDFKVDVALGGEPLSRAEREALLAGADDLVLLKGQWVEVDRDRLRQAIDHWDTLRQAGNGGVSFVDGMRLLAGASADLRHEETGGRRTLLGARHRRGRHAGDSRGHAPARRSRAGGARRGTAGHAAAVSARRRDVAAFSEPVGPRRVSGRRHGSGQDHSGAGASPL